VTNDLCLNECETLLRICSCRGRLHRLWKWSTASWHGDEYCDSVYEFDYSIMSIQEGNGIVWILIP
jgi:hypothetical protein